jgi:hypothetical protein
MFNILLNNYIHYLSCIIHPWQPDVLGQNLAAQKNIDEDSLTNRLTINKPTPGMSPTHQIAPQLPLWLHHCP